MRAWKHIAYVTAIAGLGLIILTAYHRGVPTAEKLLLPPLRQYAAVGGPGNRMVSFSGLWHDLDGDGPQPLHQFSYRCWESDHFCEVADADVHANNVIVSGSRMEVVAWDNNELVARDTGLCFETTIVVDLLTEKVSKTEKDTPDRNTAFCKASAPTTNSMLIGMLEMKPWKQDGY